MIKLMNKQDIILMYIRDKKSKRAIARETGFARKTVDKYINEYETNLMELGVECNDDIKRQELIQQLTNKPEYKSSPRVKTVVTDALIKRIQFYLDENKTKRLTGLSKQQKKKKDIYEVLVSEGFNVSYTTVSRTINKIEQKAQEAYIKQQYVPGDVVEFDWGSVKIYTEGGVLREYQMAVFTAAYSNFRWAKLFPKQNTQCFLESHSDFFEYVNGSFAEVVYDNMRLVIKKFVGRNEKEPTEALLKLSLYYRFNFRFCNVRSGNEKGHVERSVEVIRRKAFSKKDRFNSLDEANQYLLETCQFLNERHSYDKEKSPKELFQDEKAKLLPTFGKYESARLELLRVDKYSTVVVDTCHYSVPDRFVNKILKCNIYSNDIIVYFEEEKVAHHKKNPGAFQWIIKLEHYLNTLYRKPNALINSCAFKQIDGNIQNIYNSFFIGKEKDFIELLNLIGEVGIESVERSIEVIRKITPTSVTLDKIKFICQRNDEEDYYKQYFENDSSIVNNSINLLNNYAELLSERKDGMS